MGEKVQPNGEVTRRAFLGLVLPELRYALEVLNQATLRPELDEATKGGLALRASLLLASCGLAELDPAAVEARVEELLILNTLETGTYNRESLLRWQELEPQPKLDDRIGISIHPSKYVRGEGSLEWHVDIASRLGFQRVSIVASPKEHEDHTGIETLKGTTLDELIRRPYYETVFGHPDIKAIHITCDVNGPGTVNGWQLPEEGVCTPERLEATYKEYLRVADYLLERYGENGKEITIGGPNELELLAKGDYSPGTEGADISPQFIKNAILYYNTFHRAIRDANRAHSDKAPLKTGAEVLQIRSEWDRPDAKTGLDVLSALDVPPDEVSLSAWQVAGKGQEGYNLGASLRLMRDNLPQSRLAVSEFGIADKDRPEWTREEVARQHAVGVQVAWETNAAYVTIWGLTDYDSDVINPDNAETRGLGLIRPDGSLRKEVYNALRRLSGVKPIQDV